MKGFTINVLISRKQFKRYNLAYMNKFKPFYALRVFWAVTLVFIIGIANLVMQQVYPAMASNSTMIYVLILFPFIILALRLLVANKAAKSYDSNVKIQNAIEYTFDEQQIKSKGYNFESVFPWKEMNRIVKTKEFMLIFVTLTAAIIIPMSDLIDEEVAFIEQQFANRNN